MILLADNFLFFQLPSGESVPFTAEMISVELADGSAEPFDQEFLEHAAASVFHYFKNDLERKTVSVAEFASAFESALNSLGLKLCGGRIATARDDAANKDLQMLAYHAGGGGELAFFPRLRTAVRAQFQLTPRLIRFHGLRDCVKSLLGAERWSPRCDQLRDQIIEFLRRTLSKETAGSTCALLVE
ncbi:MAG: hypothetical protein QM813_27680 [Verrucomicrobiota bacterium]